MKFPHSIGVVFGAVITMFFLKDILLRFNKCNFTVIYRRYLSTKPSFYRKKKPLQKSTMDPNVENNRLWRYTIAVVESIVQALYLRLREHLKRRDKRL